MTEPQSSTGPAERLLVGYGRTGFDFLGQTISVSAALRPAPFVLHGTATVLAPVLVQAPLRPAPFVLQSAATVLAPVIVQAHLQPGPFILHSTIQITEQVFVQAALRPGPFVLQAHIGVEGPPGPTEIAIPDPLAAALAGMSGPVVLGVVFEQRDVFYNWFADVTTAIERCDIALDNDQPVARTATFTVHAPALPPHFQASLLSGMAVSVTVQVLVAGAYTSLPWGLFIWDTPQRAFRAGGQEHWTVQASDLSIALSYRTVLNPYTVGAGTQYLSAVTAILSGFNLPYRLPADTTPLPVDVTWQPQTSYLQICNDLLQGLGYYGLWADNRGVLTTAPRIDPATGAPAVVYSTIAEPRMIHEGTPLTETLDTSTYANVCTAAIDDPLRAAVFTSHTNADPTSPISTVSLGKSLLKDLKGNTTPGTKCVVDGGTTGRLAAWELQEANARAQAAEFATLLDPRRTNREYYTLTVDTIEQATLWRVGKWSCSLDPMAPGGLMKHTVGRAQAITLT
jgi:hypothetical protein